MLTKSPSWNSYTRVRCQVSSLCVWKKPLLCAVQKYFTLFLEVGELSGFLYLATRIQALISEVELLN